MANKAVKKTKKPKTRTVCDGEIIVMMKEINHAVNDVQKLNSRIDRIVAAISTAKPITKDM